MGFPKNRNNDDFTGNYPMLSDFFRFLMVE